MGPLTELPLFEQPPSPSAERKNVTAVIVSWLGAKPKHVLKYSELYSSIGCRTLTVVPAVAAVLSPMLATHASHSIAKRLAEATSDEPTGMCLHGPRIGSACVH